MVGKSSSGKMWMKFKRDFTVAHRDFRLTNHTAQQAGFHSANMIIGQGCGETMQDTVGAIAQLATAMTSDRGAVATLTATNAHTYIKTLKEEIVVLKAKIKAAWQGQRPERSTSKDTYFFFHGYKFHKNHTSTTCNAKKDGHKDMAINANPMGEVKWGK
jgi:hypothetical protein